MISEESKKAISQLFEFVSTHKFVSQLKYFQPVGKFLFFRAACSSAEPDILHDISGQLCFKAIGWLQQIEVRLLETVEVLLLFAQLLDHELSSRKEPVPHR